MGLPRSAVLLTWSCWRCWDERPSPATSAALLRLSVRGAAAQSEVTYVSYEPSPRRQANRGETADFKNSVRSLALPCDPLAFPGERAGAEPPRSGAQGERSPAPASGIPPQGLGSRRTAPRAFSITARFGKAPWVSPVGRIKNKTSCFPQFICNVSGTLIAAICYGEQIGLHEACRERGLCGDDSPLSLPSSEGCPRQIWERQILGD